MKKVKTGIKGVQNTGNKKTEGKKAANSKGSSFVILIDKEKPQMMMKPLIASATTSSSNSSSCNKKKKNAPNNHVASAAVAANKLRPTRRKKQKYSTDGDVSALQPLFIIHQQPPAQPEMMPPIKAVVERHTAARTTRTAPEMMAKILLLLYTHTKGTEEFDMYNISISEFMQLAGMVDMAGYKDGKGKDGKDGIDCTVIPDEYLWKIDKCLRPNNFCLLRMRDCFIVTTLAEMLLVRHISPKVIRRYLPGKDTTSIEEEYAKTRKIWRWSSLK